MTEPDGGSIDLGIELFNALHAPMKGRIFALMGANGAGKTRLLNTIEREFDSNPGDRRHSHMLQQTPPKFESPTRSFLIPANRTFQSHSTHVGMVRLSDSPDSVIVWDSMIDVLAPMHRQGVAPAPSGPPQILLANAINSIAATIVQKERGDDHQFREALVAWADGGQQGLCPKRTPSLRVRAEEQLGLILGCKCTIASDGGSPGTARFSFSRNRSSFPADALSDGEKQILLASALLLSSGESEFVCLVDEPELYLNEARAIELWEKIERSFPKAVFLYATHNLLFATRPTVDRAFLIQPDGNVEEIDRDKPLSSDVVRSFVGTRLQLMTKDRPVIFCEDSLLKLLVEDIFKNDKVDLVAVGSCHNVIASVRGEAAGWDRIRSSGHKYCGVIDRDMRDDDEIDSLAKQGTICLPIYEAESFLLVPEVAIWMLSISSGQPVECSQYAQVLAKAARNELPDTLGLLAKYTSDRSRPTLKLKANYSTGTFEVDVGPPTNAPDDRFRTRANALWLAIQNNDASAIVRHFQGDRLYKKFAPLAKEIVRHPIVIDPSTKYNEIRRLADFDTTVATVPWVQGFRESILARLF